MLAICHQKLPLKYHQRLLPTLQAPMNLKVAPFPIHIYVSYLSLSFTKNLFLYLFISISILRSEQYCSNENSCVCFMGFAGYVCSQVVPTLQPPPPIRRTASPPINTPPSVDKSHSTPTNTYIRKSYFFNSSHSKRHILQYWHVIMSSSQVVKRDCHQELSLFMRFFEGSSEP